MRPALFYALNTAVDKIDATDFPLCPGQAPPARTVPSFAAGAGRLIDARKKTVTSGL